MLKKRLREFLLRCLYTIADSDFTLIGNNNTMMGLVYRLLSLSWLWHHSGLPVVLADDDHHNVMRFDQDFLSTPELKEKTNSSTRSELKENSSSRGEVDHRQEANDETRSHRVVEYGSPKLRRPSPQELRYSPQELLALQAKMHGVVHSSHSAYRLSI